MIRFYRWGRSDAARARRIVKAAIAKLPREIQLEVTAALRDYIEPPRRLPAAEAPPYVFVVKEGRILAYNAIREMAWARPDLLGVTFERRWPFSIQATVYSPSSIASDASCF